jgi:diguanylate cyclase (GGDEF)-like protein
MQGFAHGFTRCADTFMNPTLLAKVLKAQQCIIEKIALSSDLTNCLNEACRQIEAILEGSGAMASILLLHGDRVRQGAAPSLPPLYCAAIENARIGPVAGSCGTAIYRRQQVIVTDIEHDPLWTDYKQLALPNGLRACWSTPIMSSGNEVLGAFAIYYDHVARPREFHLELIDRFTHLTSLAIEKDMASRRERQLAFFDPLTNLPNRRLLFDRLQMVIEKVRRDNTRSAVLYVDLNDFKRINDSLGHDVGDRLLTQVAERIKPIMRNADTLARIGGDEFVILIDSGTQRLDVIINEATAISQRITQCLAQPFQLHNGSYKIGASIGVYILDGTDTTVADALKRADSAMYAAKKTGGGIAFFDPRLQDISDRRLLVEREIVSALEQRQFCAWFQPILTLTGEPIGAEALLRWEHPDRGMISPQDFIPFAENSGLICNLQDVVMHDACRLLATMKAHGLGRDSFSISANISSSQFRSGRLDQQLMQTLRSYGVSPQMFTLEITESLLLENKSEAIMQMKQLKQRGFRFSVDDFGTGYSSLAYLHALPLDELKIDRSFVSQIDTNDSSLAIIDSIISLAQNLHFSVIAEGIETDEQQSTLAQRPIHGMQGFLFSRPMPAPNFIEWVTAQGLQLQYGAS